MDNLIMGALLGVLVGFFIGASMNYEFNSILKEGRSIVLECEKSLPRDKVCELVLSTKVAGE